MDQKTFEQLLKEAQEIEFLIIDDGGMATKTAVETILMNRHPDLSRADAHTITNAKESAVRVCNFRGGELAWTAPRDQPKPEDWPEVYPARVVDTTRDEDGTRVLTSLVNELIRQDRLDNATLTYRAQKAGVALAEKNVSGLVTDYLKEGRTEILVTAVQDYGAKNPSVAITRWEVVWPKS